MLLESRQALISYQDHHMLCASFETGLGAKLAKHIGNYYHREIPQQNAGPSRPFAFSVFRTRITTCYPFRVETALSSYQDDHMLSFSS